MRILQDRISKHDVEISSDVQLVDIRAALPAMLPVTAVPTLDYLQPASRLKVLGVRADRPVGAAARLRECRLGWE